MQILHWTFHISHRYLISLCYALYLKHQDPFVYPWTNLLLLIQYFGSIKDPMPADYTFQSCFRWPAFGNRSWNTPILGKRKRNRCLFQHFHECYNHSTYFQCEHTFRWCFESSMELFLRSNQILVPSHSFYCFLNFSSCPYFVDPFSFGNWYELQDNLQVVFLPFPLWDHQFSSSWMYWICLSSLSQISATSNSILAIILCIWYGSLCIYQCSLWLVAIYPLWWTSKLAW